MTTTTKKTTTATPTNTFPDLVKRFSTLASNPDPDSDPTAYEKSLTDLAIAVVYSVLNKCIDPQRKGGKQSDSGYDPTVVKMKSAVTSDKKQLDNINMLISTTTYHTEYDKNGDPVSVCDDPEKENNLVSAICGELLSNGCDLIHDAILAILTECTKQKDRDPDSVIDLEKPYTVKRLKKKVYIKKADSIGGYETIETTPIQEVFKTVRRCIENERSVKTDPKNGYTYISDYISDPENENDNDPTTIYYRLPKYADLGGYAKDSNGKETNYTTDSATVEKVEKLIEKLNLTKRQAIILQLRLKGYGYKAIATYIGISADNVKSQIKELRRKAKRIDLTPEKFKFNPDPTPTATPDPTPTAKRPTKKTPTEKIIIPPVNIPVTPVHKDPDPVRIYAKKIYKPDGSFTFRYILHK